MLHTIKLIENPNGSSYYSTWIVDVAKDSDVVLLIDVR